MSELFGQSRYAKQLDPALAGFSDDELSRELVQRSRNRELEAGPRPGDIMTPGEAYRLVSDTMPEELRGEEVGTAFGVLWDLVAADITRRECELS